MPDTSKTIRTLAAEYGFHDPIHAGELNILFDGAGRRRKYLRRSGISLDAFAEILWDRGLTPGRPDLHEVYALLESAFSARNKPKTVRRRASKRSILGEIDAKAARAKRNRLRKNICEECSAIMYASAIVVPEHCGRATLRLDPTFAEVMTQTAAIDVAPF